MVPTPTPALAATSRTGASTPDVTKTSAAALSSVSLLRRASARLERAACPLSSSLSFTLPLPHCLSCQNGTMFRIVVSGTRFRLLMMSEPEPGHQAMPQWRNTLMQYRTLGRTGVQVSSLALGAMNFGRIGRTTQDEATAIVDAALEAGVNLIDTADAYSGGESEEMVGKAVAGRRDDIVLATKATLPMGEERNHRGGSRRWLVTALEDSLRRLGVDHVDLYQMHRWDPRTSDEETLSALTDLQTAGKIRYF